MNGNWIRQTTTTTGASDITLAAVTGFPTAAQEFGINQPFAYTIVLDSAPDTPVESGIGKMSSSTNMVRSSITSSVVSGTYTGVGATAVTLGAGPYRVVCTWLSQLGGVTAVPAFHPSASIKAQILYPYISAGNSKALSANTPIFVCGRFDGRDLPALGANVTTLGGTGTDKFRIGVYSINTDGSIGDLVCQSGDMLPNTTGMKSATISGGTYRLPPGWYYVAILSTVAVTLRASMGGNTTIAQTLPTGLESTGVNTYSAGLASAVSAGWSSMPTNITVSSLISMGSDYAPTIFVY